MFIQIFKTNYSICHQWKLKENVRTLLNWLCCHSFVLPLIFFQFQVNINPYRSVEKIQKQNIRAVKICVDFEEFWKCFQWKLPSVMREYMITQKFTNYAHTTEIGKAIFWILIFGFTSSTFWNILFRLESWKRKIYVNTVGIWVWSNNWKIQILQYFLQIMFSAICHLSLNENLHIWEGMLMKQIIYKYCGFFGHIHLIGLKN